MGYLVCRRCGARIDLPHITHVWQVPSIFSATCGRCGRTMAYSYVDLKDVRFPTKEEAEQARQLEYMVHYCFFREGVRGALESMVLTLRKIREELERRSLQPSTPVNKSCNRPRPA